MSMTEHYDETTTKYTTVLKVKENSSNYNSQNQELNDLRKTKLLKRIPLSQLMDLKVDYAFKQLFGIEKNKHITVVFLNAILQKTGRNRIKDIAFANTETGGEYTNDKQSRLDLLVMTDDQEWTNVEIQFSNPYEMIERSVYYWSRTYTNPLEKGMEYEQLRPVIAINILNFNLFEQTERFHTSYHLYEDESQFKLTNMMEFHFIEMTKLIKDWKAEELDPRNDILARWLLMLGMVDHRNKKIYDDIYSELEEIAMKDESLHEAFGDWEELSMTQEQRLAYESRLKRVLDEEAFKAKMERLKRENFESEQRIIELEQRNFEREQKNIEQEQKNIEWEQTIIERELNIINREQMSKRQETESEKKSKDVEKRYKEIEQHKEKLERDQRELEQRKNEVELNLDNLNKKRKNENGNSMK